MSGSREDVALGALGVARSRQVAVGDRVDQQLAGDLADRRRRGRAGSSDRRDVAARAPACDRQLARDAAELDRVVGDPAHGGEPSSAAAGKRCSGAWR